MTEGGLNSVLVIKGSFFLKKKRKKVSKKKKQLSTHRHIRTCTHAHIYTTFVFFSQNQSQTGFRIKKAWDHVFGVRPAGAQSLLLEGTSCFFRMPTAASNRHWQIQGTVVASLEDGHFWIYIHIQNKKIF